MKVTGLVVLLVLALATGIWQGGRGDDRLQQTGVMIYRQGVAVPAVSFVDQHGQPRDQSLFQGRWSLVFFGYTFCPDICPTTLADMNRVWKQLNPEVRGKLQLVLVSVDPQRDSVESLQPYLKYFNPEFIGLTGNPQSLPVLATALNGFYARVERGDGAPYLMDHSANLALVDPQGQYRGYIEPPFKGERMVTVLEALTAQ